jgi:hypothetical protein
MLLENGGEERNAKDAALGRAAWRNCAATSALLSRAASRESSYRSVASGYIANLSASDDQTFVDLEADIRLILSKPATGRTASAAILYVERFLQAAGLFRRSCASATVGWNRLKGGGI